MTKSEITRKYALDHVGFPYIFATDGQECTPSRRIERAKAKPDYAANIKKYCPVLSGKAQDCNGCKYEGKEAFDCRGIVYRICKASGIKISSIGATSQRNGDYWSEVGPISEMPGDRQCAVFVVKDDKASHVGWHIGNGEIVEARGHAYGVVLSHVNERTFNEYRIPRGLYEGEEQMTYSEEPRLYKGMYGPWVKSLQSILVVLGYNLGKYGPNKDGVDGDFGGKTENAVKAFQMERGMVVNGVVDVVEWDALKLHTPEDEPENEPEIVYCSVSLINVPEADVPALLAKYPGSTKAVG